MPTDAPSAPAPSAPAPAAPAAAAPTPAAPVAAPVSTSVSTPAAPAVETTAPGTSVITEPAAGATPSAAPVATEGPVQPKASDFEDGGAFLTAHSKWEREKAEWDEAHPEGDAPKTEEAAKPEETKVEETKEQEVSKIEEDDTPAPTPAALDSLIKGDEALKAALEANPKAKGEIFKMARRLAETEPIAAMFPTVDSAKFAQETAGQYVGLRGKFEAAVEDPDAIGDAFSAFVDQFTIVDKDGKPVLDAKGQPQLAEDFNLLTSHIRQLDIEGNISELEERLKADNYKSPAAKERDEQRLMAFQFIKDDSEAADVPDYSHLPEQARKEAEAKDAEIKRLQEELTGKKEGQTKEAKKAARDAWEGDFNKGYAEMLWKQSEGVVKELRDAGLEIPQWMLSVTAPGSKVPVFYLNVLKKLGDIFKGDAHTQNQAKNLQRMAPTPENLKERLDFFSGLAKTNLRSIIKAEVSEGSKKSAPAVAKPEEVPNPSVEPRSGAGISPPTGLTLETATQTAREQLSREITGWSELDPSERNAHVMTRVSRLMNK